MEVPLFPAYSMLIAIFLAFLALNPLTEKNQKKKSFVKGAKHALCALSP